MAQKLTNLCFFSILAYFVLFCPLQFLSSVCYNVYVAMLQVSQNLAYLHVRTKGENFVKEFFRRDIIFLHAPSVYDFRKDTIMFGPISDVIPSSATFEMYPIGITSIADTLEKSGFNVQIINLAYQMMRKANYDVEKVIAKANPRMFAIDLHWLPHCHGSIEIARIIKKYHPNTPILFGGTVIFLLSQRNAILRLCRLCY